MNEPPRDLVAIAIFGSAARGDNDKDSDIDILAVVNTIDYQQQDLLRATITNSYNCHIEQVSIYTRSSLCALKDRGNPFIHHLAKEAIVTYDPDLFLKTLLMNVPEFDGYGRFLEKYADLLSLVQTNVNSPQGLSECDLHLLFMICRNVAILDSIQNEKPNFGRMSCVLQMADRYGVLQPNIPLLQELSCWSLVYKRHSEAPDIFPDRVMQEHFFNVSREFLRCGKNGFQ